MAAHVPMDLVIKLNVNQSKKHASQYDGHSFPLMMAGMFYALL